MGGGPSREQKTAAASQARLADESAANSREMMGVYKGQLAKIEPYATSRLNNGLPYFDALTDFNTGTTAQAFKPAYAALNRRLSTFGALPSGFKTQATTDLDAERARYFDSTLRDTLGLNETAKNNAAAMLVGQQQLSNPLGWSQNAMSGNQSIMQAPLAKPGIAGILGGAAAGAASAIPF